MRKLYWLIAGVAAAAVILAVTQIKRQGGRDEEDGGVRHRVDTNAPKVILSTQIVSFRCKFSTMDLTADIPIFGQIFTLYAGEDGGSYEARNRREVNASRDFTPTPDFFARLQQIVAKYDFAQHNGQYYTVSGLPPDYGMELEILYASGERVSTKNNQSCFLSLEAMNALVELFREA